MIIYSAAKKKPKFLRNTKICLCQNFRLIQQFTLYLLNIRWNDGTQNSRTKKARI